MNLKEAIQDTKDKLRRRGWQVFEILASTRYHLLAFEPGGPIHLIAITRLCHLHRKKQALKVIPDNSSARVDIFCY